jgi:hypothetical protein
MIGLDCNILVRLAFADHPANAKTVVAVKTDCHSVRYSGRDPVQTLVNSARASAGRDFATA